MRNKRILAILFGCFFFVCWISEGQSTARGLELVDPNKAPRFVDDSDLGDLKDAIRHSLEYYSQLPKDSKFRFGQKRYGLEVLVESLEILEKFLQTSPKDKDLDQFVREHFHIYRSPGSDSQGKVVFSAYYEHSLSAKLSPDSEYHYPIYGRPPELVDVYLEGFDPKRKGERIVGKVEGGVLVPYYKREEIDSQGKLKGRNLEIAWAKDPLDIFFLQIQGSGWIDIPNSREIYHIRYAGDNGRKYRSIGRTLIKSGEIRREKFSRKALKRYLGRQTEKNRQEILNRNPRYIFFEVVSSTHQTRGSLLVPITAGRSVASDPKYFPQGALAWIKTRRPVLDSKGALKGSEPLARFVLNQDEGGAIKGLGRIDFFAGGGLEAERMAQKLWYPGEIYLFIKK